MADPAVARLFAVHPLLIWAVRRSAPAYSGPWPKGTEWQQIVSQSIFHGVLPLLYQRLKRKDNQVPAQVWRVMADAYAKNSRRTLIMVRTLLFICHALQSRRLPVLAIKGPVLAVQAYNDMNSRNFTDLDILVHAKDLAAVCRQLTGMHFLPMQRFSAQTLCHWARTGRDFTFSRERLFIDVHQRLMQGPERAFCPTVWRNAVTVRLLGHDIHTLNPVSHALFVCWHGWNAGWLQLKMVADLAHLVGRFGPDEWQKLHQLAARSGLLRMVGMSLELLHTLCPGEAPMPWGHAYKARAVAPLVRAVRETADSHSFNTRAVSLLDTRRLKARFVLYHLFTPGITDMRMFAAPRRLYRLYYLIRPVRLFLVFLWRAITGKGLGR